MRRNVSLSEISDGKLYELNDMVRADCGGCKGCSACCRNMEESIVLDPLDIFRLRNFLQVGFDDLLKRGVTLRVIDGVILPVIGMSGEGGACGFLDENGRCSVHEARPGICRIFPLGRYYEEDGFRYFLQIYECKNKNLSKVKVRKWIDTPNLKENQKYLFEWHRFLQRAESALEGAEDEGVRKNISMYILENFFRRPYEAGRDFYSQFSDWMGKACQVVPEKL